MAPQQAAQLVEQLALGIDPRTGAPLAEGDACTAPEVIRALFLARNALQGAREPLRRPPVVRNGVTLVNVGKKWSGEEVDTLLQAFQAGMPLGRIAVQLGRTDGSIVARLVQAGALPDRDSGYTLLKAQQGGELAGQ